MVRSIGSLAIRFGLKTITVHGSKVAMLQQKRQPALSLRCLVSLLKAAPIKFISLDRMAIRIKFQSLQIRAKQSQNTTAHFGASGDCGMADATWSNVKNGFAFTLDHKAAYLLFLPRTANTIFT